MRVLITGASGQVGRALLSTKPAHVDAVTFTHGQLDICNAEAVQQAVATHAPLVVINAAAYTAVDRAEQEDALAMTVNGTGPGFLADAVRTVPGARLIQVSTDYVFDGHGARPYRIDDPTDPISVYGRTKLAGEQAVLEKLGDHAVVLRTAWVYAAEGKNFLLTMLRLMRERGTVRVVSDQRGSPTAARSVARALWRIVELSGAHGVLHWTDEGTASWYEFACAIAEDAVTAGLLERTVEVQPIKTTDYPTDAHRPENSVLDMSDTINRLNLQPTPWRECLRSTLSTLANH